PLRPEVHQHDPQAVERVEQEHRHEPGLHEPHDRVLVGVHDPVEELARHADHRDVDDMDDEEEEQGHTGDAVQHPRPHAFTTAVEGPYRRAGHVCEASRLVCWRARGRPGPCGCPADSGEGTRTCGGTCSLYPRCPGPVPRGAVTSITARTAW